MKRTFNFTGNRKLDGCFIANFDESQSPLVIRATIDSKSKDLLKDLSPNFEVALAVSDVLRFDYKVGTLADVIMGNGFTVVLKDFTPEGVKPQVDLRIVDLTTKKIEASAEDLVPDVSQGPGRRSFVKLSLSHAIGKEIWRSEPPPMESRDYFEVASWVDQVVTKFAEKIDASARFHYPPEPSIPL